MRTSIFTFILFVFAIVIVWQCARPVSSILGLPDNPAPLRAPIEDVIKGLKDPGFKKNELVVFFRQSPDPESINKIKAMMKQKGIDTSLITVRTCNACSANIQLWNAPDIYSYVVSEGVRSGSGGGGSNGVGEDSLARYSLNFTSQLPVDSLAGVFTAIGNYNKQTYPVNNLAGKDVVKIAVLDTGVDTLQFIHSSYLWTNGNELPNRNDDDKNCYTDDVAGWNFLADNADFRDNNRNIHGTLVTKYIIDQFRSSSTTGVQIMALKTHDANGAGSLFASICALYYAIEKGAQIVNASWGFYNYGDNPVPYLDSLVTQVLPQHGILFVTAAGNKVQDNDDFARSLYRAMHPGFSISEAGLRNLQIHNFYPAMLSRPGNNVITNTTTDGVSVSPTQNFSSLYVDLGVRADRVTATSMKFRVPFEIRGSEHYISGSSFATAIATGKIGALLKKDWYRPGLTKEGVFSEISGVIRTSTELSTRSLIREGRYILP